MDWDSIQSYFQNQGVAKLVDHQIESFEDFIRNKIPLIVVSTAPIVVWHEQDELTKKYKYEFRLSFENKDTPIELMRSMVRDGMIAGFIST